MIALLTFMTMAMGAHAMPAYGAEAAIAFNCGLDEIVVSRRVDHMTMHQISVLADFAKGSGAVVDTYDPDTVMSGATFSTILVGQYPDNKDAYFFVLQTKPAKGQATLLIRPDGPLQAAGDEDFIGILAFKQAAKPTHMGRCEILRGQRAMGLFRDFRSPKAQ